MLPVQSLRRLEDVPADAPSAPPLKLLPFPAPPTPRRTRATTPRTRVLTLATRLGWGRTKSGGYERIRESSFGTTVDTLRRVSKGWTVTISPYSGVSAPNLADALRTGQAMTPLSYGPVEEYVPRHVTRPKRRVAIAPDMRRFGVPAPRIPRDYRISQAFAYPLAKAAIVFLSALLLGSNFAKSPNPPSAEQLALPPRTLAVAVPAPAPSAPAPIASQPTVQQTPTELDLDNAPSLFDPVQTPGGVTVNAGEASAEHPSKYQIGEIVALADDPSKRCMVTGREWVNGSYLYTVVPLSKMNIKDDKARKTASRRKSSKASTRVADNGSPRIHRMVIAPNGKRLE